VLGAAAIAMWWNVAPEARAEWEDWHTREHMPERLAIPGFLRGSRWSAPSAEPSGACSYFVCYETEDLQTITSGPYLERLNNPSPWSRKMMPHHQNMVRSLCLVRSGAALDALPPFLATIRFSGGSRPQFAGNLLESQTMPGQTTEQRIRGKDATAGWIGLLGGADANALSASMSDLATHGTIGIYRRSHSLSRGENA
jgi:hypothetical protein